MDTGLLVANHTPSPATRELRCIRILLIISLFGILVLMPTTPMDSVVTMMSRLLLLSSSSRGSWRPSVALKPSYYPIKSQRPLTVTYALPEKDRPMTFSIPPTALLCPVSPPDGTMERRWNIKEEEDRVTLWLQVPGVSAKDIEVTTSEDVLEIKRKVAIVSGNGREAADVHAVGAFHIRLLMTGQYDHDKVMADLREGMLEVVVYKNQRLKGKPVTLGAALPREVDASSGVPDETKLNKNNKSNKPGPGLSS